MARNGAAVKLCTDSKSVVVTIGCDGPKRWWIQGESGIRFYGFKTYESVHEYAVSKGWKVKHAPGARQKANG